MKTENIHLNDFEKDLIAEKLQVVLEINNRVNELNQAREAKIKSIHKALCFTRNIPEEDQQHHRLLSDKDKLTFVDLRHWTQDSSGMVIPISLLENPDGESVQTEEADADAG